MESPSSDLESGGAKVGVLRKPLCGTMDAPLIWADEVRSALEGLGFRESISHPSVHILDSGELLPIIDVYDFWISGFQTVLQWGKRALEKKYDLCGAIISNRKEDAHETKCVPAVHH